MQIINNCKKNIAEFLKENNPLESTLEIFTCNADCNIAIDKIVSSINNINKYPLFVLIDPTSLQIKKATMEKIVKLNNYKDILFNYILEGVRRTSGVLKKGQRGELLTFQELKTIDTLKSFIGNDTDVINDGDRKVLENYVKVFTSQDLKVVGYDMKYSNRNDILYYFLFASKNLSITKIIKGIYAKQKEVELGPTLFGGKDVYNKEIFSATAGLIEIRRKSLLYKTKVEYGNWTINHIIGCKHGCLFPCYAMMMAKKFGWVKDYDDWRIPRIATNAIELLEKEIPKLKGQIDFVHLCFISDPFMYDINKKEIMPSIKELTLRIIEKLNQEKIRVTTLTKGVYPKDLLDKEKFTKDNEYGITLVSLNDDFKRKFEPYSASYKDRIKSLKILADNGLKTWASLEPYPTPELDIKAGEIEVILESVSFVKKIIFGKLNYRRLTDCKSNQIWENNNDFYRDMATRIIRFCKKNRIDLHIKYGTPLSRNNTVDIFNK